MTTPTLKNPKVAFAAITAIGALVGWFVVPGPKLVTGAAGLLAGAVVARVVTGYCPIGCGGDAAAAPAVSRGIP